LKDDSCNIQGFLKAQPLIHFWLHKFVESLKIKKFKKNGVLK
jgi:hypothetical protein